MKGYAVVIEGSSGSYSAYSPDLPGCVAAAETVDQVKRLMDEAVQMHIQGLRDADEPVPEPSSAEAYVSEISDAA